GSGPSNAASLLQSDVRPRERAPPASPPVFPACPFFLFLLPLFALPSFKSTCLSWTRNLKLETYLSNVVPHFLQTRTLRSPRTSWPMRTGPHVPHTSCTFETDIGRSCSARPPWMLRCGFGRTCFLTIMTCSTRTFPSSGNTRSTRPSLPLSRPLITFTVSLQRILMRFGNVLAVAIN